MSDMNIYVVAQVVAIVLSVAIGVWVLRLNAGKLAKVEPLARERKVGGILGLVGLLWVIPHAEPIVFNWMLPLLYPLAIGGAIASYYLLDYLFSRAIGGIFILTGYYFVHAAFEFHTPTIVLSALGYWGLAIVGICFSGKPHWMRDLVRKCCAEKRYRWITGLFFITLSLITLVGLLSGMGV